MLRDNQNKSTDEMDSNSEIETNNVSTDHKIDNVNVKVKTNRNSSNVVFVSPNELEDWDVEDEKSKSKRISRQRTSKNLLKPKPVKQTPKSNKKRGRGKRKKGQNPWCSEDDDHFGGDNDLSDDEYFRRLEEASAHDDVDSVQKHSVLFDKTNHESDIEEEAEIFIGQMKTFDFNNHDLLSYIISEREQTFDINDCRKPSIEFPSSSNDLNCPQDLVLQLAGLYETIIQYHNILRVSPFKIEDFIAAMVTNENSTLISEVHIAILKLLLREDELANTLLCSLDQKDSVNLAFLFIDSMTWPELLRLYIKSIDSGSLKIHIAETYPFVSLYDRVNVLSYLLDLVVDGSSVRAEVNRENVITHEDFCRVCHVSGEVLCCDSCSAVYHLECLTPQLTAVPKTTWYCPVCVKHKVQGFADCNFDGDKAQIEHKKTPLGFDRFGNTYWFLARRLIIEPRNDNILYLADSIMENDDQLYFEPNYESVLYYSSCSLLENIREQLSIEWENELCDVFDSVIEEMKKSMTITEDLTHDGFTRCKQLSKLPSEVNVLMALGCEIMKDIEEENITKSTDEVEIKNCSLKTFSGQQVGVIQDQEGLLVRNVDGNTIRVRLSAKTRGNQLEEAASQKNYKWERDTENNIFIYRLGDEGDWRLYCNLFSTEIDALSKNQHQEEKDRRRILSNKFSISETNEFQWFFSQTLNRAMWQNEEITPRRTVNDVTGGPLAMLQCLRLTLQNMETQMFSSFMCPAWKDERKNWLINIQRIRNASSLAKFVARFESAIRPCALKKAWTNSMGYLYLDRITAAEREEEKRLKTNEKKNFRGDWDVVKTRNPGFLKHTIWKTKGEEFRRLSGDGWGWLNPSVSYNAILLNDIISPSLSSKNTENSFKLGSSDDEVVNICSDSDLSYPSTSYGIDSLFKLRITELEKATKDFDLDASQKTLFDLTNTKREIQARKEKLEERLELLSKQSNQNRKRPYNDYSYLNSGEKRMRFANENSPYVGQYDGADDEDDDGRESTTGSSSLNMGNRILMNTADMKPIILNHQMNFPSPNGINIAGRVPVMNTNALNSNSVMLNHNSQPGQWTPQVVKINNVNGNQMYRFIAQSNPQQGQVNTNNCTNNGQMPIRKVTPSTQYVYINPATGGAINQQNMMFNSSNNGMQMSIKSNMGQPQQQFQQQQQHNMQMYQARQQQTQNYQPQQFAQYHQQCQQFQRQQMQQQYQQQLQPLQQQQMVQQQFQKVQPQINQTQPQIQQPQQQQQFKPIPVDSSVIQQRQIDIKPINMPTYPNITQQYRTPTPTIQSRRAINKSTTNTNFNDEFTLKKEIDTLCNEIVSCDQKIDSLEKEIAATNYRIKRTNTDLSVPFKMHEKSSIERNDITYDKFLPERNSFKWPLENSESVKSIFLFNKECLRSLVLSAGRTEVPGFDVEKKRQNNVYWPYPSARPGLSVTWKYQVSQVINSEELDNDIYELAATEPRSDTENNKSKNIGCTGLSTLALCIKVLWSSLRWDDMLVNWQQHDTTLPMSIPRGIYKGTLLNGDTMERRIINWRSLDKFSSRCSYLLAICVTSAVAESTTTNKGRSNRLGRQRNSARYTDIDDFTDEGERDSEDSDPNFIPGQVRSGRPRGRRSRARAMDESHEMKLPDKKFKEEWMDEDALELWEIRDYIMSINWRKCGGSLNNQQNLIVSNLLNKRSFQKVEMHNYGARAQTPFANMPIVQQNIPTQLAPIPPQLAPIPPQLAPIPPQNAPIPPQLAPIPPQLAPIPPQLAPIPPQLAPIPPQLAPIPPQNAPISSQNAPIPSQNAPIPSHNAPIPSQNALIAARNSSIQLQNAPFSVSTIPNMIPQNFVTLEKEIKTTEEPKAENINNESSKVNIETSRVLNLNNKLELQNEKTIPAPITDIREVIRPEVRQNRGPGRPTLQPRPTPTPQTDEDSVIPKFEELSHTLEVGSGEIGNRVIITQENIVEIEHILALDKVDEIKLTDDLIKKEATKSKKQPRKNLSKNSSDELTDNEVETGCTSPVVNPQLADEKSFTVSPRKSRSTKSLKEKASQNEEMAIRKTPRNKKRQHSSDNSVTPSLTQHKKKMQKVKEITPEKGVVYCVCRTEYDLTRGYIGCDACSNWFHFECVGITAKKASTLQSWRCEKCVPKVEEKENIVEKENIDDNEELEIYCSCRSIYDPTKLYIACDGCDEWYHPVCVGMSDEEATNYQGNYYCKKCKGAPLKSEAMSIDPDKRITSDIRKKLSDLLQNMMKHKDSTSFRKAVDVRKCPRYYQVVQSPMDLSTAKSRLDNAKYDTIGSFKLDMHKIFTACRIYFDHSSNETRSADILETYFLKELRRISNL